MSNVIIYEHNIPSAYEHFKLIRESSEYRNFLMMEEMMAEMQPEFAQNIEHEYPKTEQPVIHYQNVPLQRIDNIQRDLIELKVKLQEHLKPKKKEAPKGTVDV